MTHYAGDPYWMTCKFAGKCGRCTREIKKGERAFRYKDGTIYCGLEKCGGIASREFDAVAQDEDFLMRGS